MYDAKDSEYSMMKVKEITDHYLFETNIIMLASDAN